MGANTFRDILASIRDLIGGRARSYEVTLERAREMALQELGRRARLLGADTVVGVRVECLWREQSAPPCNSNTRQIYPYHRRRCRLSSNPAADPATP